MTCACGAIWEVVEYTGWGDHLTDDWRVAVRDGFAERGFRDCRKLLDELMSLTEWKKP